MMSLSLVGNSLALYTALTVLVGMAGVVQSPLLYSMVVAHRAPLHSRGKLIAICTTGVPLGNMAVPPLVVWLIAEFGWRGARVGLGLATSFAPFQSHSCSWAMPVDVSHPLLRRRAAPPYPLYLVPRASCLSRHFSLPVWRLTARLDDRLVGKKWVT